RSPFVIAKTKMGGESAAANHRPDRFSEYFDKAIRILPMAIAAHRRLVECDLFTTSFDQFFELSANNWNQRFCNVPAAFITSARINPATQGIGPGNASF